MLKLLGSFWADERGATAVEYGLILMNPLIFAETHIGQISWRMTGLDNPVSAKRSHESSDQAC